MKQTESCWSEVIEPFSSWSSIKDDHHCGREPKALSKQTNATVLFTLPGAVLASYLTHAKSKTSETCSTVPIWSGGIVADHRQMGTDHSAHTVNLRTSFIPKMRVKDIVVKGLILPECCAKWAEYINKSTTEEDTSDDNN